MLLAGALGAAAAAAAPPAGRPRCRVGVGSFGAAIKIVVLPYRGVEVAAGGPEAKLLTKLVQEEVGSLAGRRKQVEVVPVEAGTTGCGPSDLLDGIEVPRGRALVLLSGRFLRDGASLHVQSRVAFLRGGEPEELSFSALAAGKEVVFTGRLPSSLFDSGRRERSYTSLPFPSRRLRLGDDEARPQVADLPLRAHLPELTFVEAVVEYLRIRLGPRSRRGAVEARDRVHELLGEFRAGVASPESPELARASEAMADLLEGMLDFEGEGSEARFADARRRLPFQADVQVLELLPRLRRYVTDGGPPELGGEIERGLLAVISGDPTHEGAITNLEQLYLFQRSLPGANARSAGELDRRFLCVRRVRQKLGRLWWPHERIDFEDQQPNRVVSSVFGDRGSGPVRVAGANPRFASRNSAVVFDSAQPWEGDPDLGTPNWVYGGPGGPSKSRSNDRSQNNVLVVSKQRPDREGMVKVADDEQVRGGILRFDFSALGSVTLHGMTFIDIDEGAVMVRLFDRPEGDAVIEFLVAETADNGARRVNTGRLGEFSMSSGIPGVVRMEVEMGGSGAIDDIVFREPAAAARPEKTGSARDLARFEAIAARLESSLARAEKSLSRAWRELREATDWRGRPSYRLGQLGRILDDQESELLESLDCPRLASTGCAELGPLREWLRRLFRDARRQLRAGPMKVSLFPPDPDLEPRARPGGWTPLARFRRVDQPSAEFVHGMLRWMLRRGRELAEARTLRGDVAFRVLTADRGAGELSLSALSEPVPSGEERRLWIGSYSFAPSDTSRTGPVVCETGGLEPERLDRTCSLDLLDPSLEALECVLNSAGSDERSTCRLHYPTKPWTACEPGTTLEVPAD